MKSSIKKLVAEEIKKMQGNGGRNGTGASKRRPAAHYKMLAKKRDLAREIKNNGLMSKNGLLYRGRGRGAAQIHLPESDALAIRFGYQCAEQLVRALNEKQREARCPKN